MQMIIDNIKFLKGDFNELLLLENNKNLAIFDESIIEYLDLLSKSIFKNPKSVLYPDLITFAFWIRKSSIYSIRSRYLGQFRIGKGTVFHIAPSNVPINFAYSLVTGLLSGNSNIVRLSSKNFEQINILCDIINKLDYHPISNYFVLIQYEHNKEITDYLSRLCDTRIIWGGDNTIEKIRESRMKSRANEITFADRDSIAIINAEKYLELSNKEQLAKSFFNDTYLTDQNACTSPKIIIWDGIRIAEAQELFWNHLYDYVIKNYELPTSKCVEKYANSLIFSTVQEDLKLKRYGNYIYIIDVENIPVGLDEYYGNSGYFIQYSIKNDLSEISHLMNDKIQTVAYFGYEIDRLKSLILNSSIKGIDRIVPIGKTMDFDMSWDGYDLIISTSRIIDCK
jgi:hypothetical protein